MFELILKQKTENSRNEKEITSFEFKNLDVPDIELGSGSYIMLFYTTCKYPPDIELGCGSAIKLLAKAGSAKTG